MSPDPARATVPAGADGRVRLLIVDDEAAFARILAAQLTLRGYETFIAAGASEGLEAARTGAPDAILLDYALPDTSGLVVLSSLRAIDPTVTVIILSGSIDVPASVQAIRDGAEDVLTKPVELEHLLASIERGLARTRLMRSQRLQRSQVADPYGIFDDSPMMQRVLRLAEGISRSDLPVLIVGEPGSGKRVVADLVHQLSPLAAAPFISLSCTGKGGDELERLLFGDGQAAELPGGLIARAAGGTLFLDDVSRLSERVQALLLTVIESSAAGRRGDARLPGRLIVATRRDLSEDVRRGLLRADLYQRLAVVPIAVPSLRDRGSATIASLARRFVRMHRADLGEGPLDLSDAAAALLGGVEWPGNVPQLRAVLRTAFVRALDVATIEPVHLRSALEEHGARADDVHDAQQDWSLRAAERQHIQRVMALAGGHRTNAARLLGITRTTLYKKLAEYGLDESGD